MKTKTILIIFLAFASIGIYLILSNNNDTKVSPKVETKENEADRIIKTFVAKYQPKTDISPSSIYSFQLENELVKSGKPILFTANLDDVVAKNGDFIFNFSPTTLDFLPPRIFYTLQGCKQNIAKIHQVDQRAFDLGGYIVVAKINTIKKALVRIDGTAGSDGGVELSLAEPNSFIATGDCIDFEYTSEQLP